MQCISNLEEYQDSCHTAITLGKFDGLHKGHQQLVEKVSEYAREDGVKSIAFVFDMSLFYEKLNKVPRTLMTKEERRRQLSDKVDCLVECPFTDEIRLMEAETFIEKILVEKFHAKYIVVGTDYSFGYQKRGDYRMLKAYAEIYDFEVEVIDKIRYDDREISSTFVREMVEAGKMEEAARMLGHAYRILGHVAHGRKLGRKLGIPTMNVPVSTKKLLPPNGVYAARGILDGISYDGIANIGSKPTVLEDGEVLAELHLFSYDGDAYGKEIEIELYEFERPEMKFASVEELKERMQKDIAYGKAYFHAKDKRR